jgi:hypothetical protein
MSTEILGALLVLLLAVSCSCEQSAARKKRVSHDETDKMKFLHALRGLVQQREV